MVNCTSKSDGKKEILPIFFDVEPDDVKLKTNLYRDALFDHEKKYSSREVKSWGDALVAVPTRVSWKLEGKGYGELIKLIVREVLLKLKKKNRPLPVHLVETDDLKHIEKLLDVGSDDHIRFVILHGTGGVGKSTLASVIFNRFRSKFNCSSFLGDVQSHGLLDMQKKLLSETLGLNSAQEIYDTNDGIDHIMRGLGKKKVLVVVDNVDEKKQLENLAGSCDWFGCGSRIIVTVRDLRTIRNKDNLMRPSNYMDYSIKEMPFDQAIQLFSKHAFRSDTPLKDCYKFSKEVVSIVGKLPLTLEVVGSLFAYTIRSEWDERLEELKRAPYKDVRQTLMISINKLDRIEKAIFLDIACFCVGEDKTYAEYMWSSSDYSPRSAIDVLLLMSLIKLEEDDNTFWMHDEVRDLGRYIVKEENFEDAAARRWVRIDENTLDILRSNEEKGAVRALNLGISHDLTPEELAYLPMLRFLGGERLNFVGNFKNLLHNLRWLSWHHCPLYFSATNLQPVNLVVLDLSQSRITHDWGGWRQIKMAKKLKVLDLTCCSELTKTPDFPEFSKLEKLILYGCTKLSTIDSSIGNLKLLRTLNIDKCDFLEGLPEEISSLECLSEIILPYFGNPIKLPEALGNLKSLTTLEIQSGINHVPPSIGRLNLTNLALTFCKNLHELPDSIGELKSLVKLDLHYSRISVLPCSIGRLKNLKHLLLCGCKKLNKLPGSIGCLDALIELDLSSSTISILPNSIGRLKNLWYLLLAKCNNLYKLPDSIGELESLVKLDLKLSSVSVIPNSIGRLMNLTNLSFSECDNLLELPDSIGELESLVELDLNHLGISVVPNSIGRLKNLQHLLLAKCKNLYELPDSIGQMELLVELDLKSSGISLLPNSIGNLKRLKVLNVAYTKIHTMPSALAGLEMLEELDASFCPYLIDEIPWEMWSLTRLRILDLNSSPISTVPRKISGFSSLQMLKIASHRLSLLPELPSNLKFLVVVAAEFPVLPELSSLVHLHHLEVRKQCMTLWIPNEVTSPWKDVQSINRLPLSLSILKLQSILQLPDIFYFQSLSVLSISECLAPCLSDLSRLKRLQELRLSNFPKLAEILNLGELESLEFLYIIMCDVIRQLPNLSKLNNLLHLELKHCAKLRAVEGLKELKILKNVKIKWCMSLERLPDVPLSTKLETNWTPPKPAEDIIQPAKRLRLSLE